MKDLIIIGAGGFARESIWIAERMNAHAPQWNILGYIDDGKEPGTDVDGYPVLGKLSWIRKRSGPFYAVCAVGTSRLRKQMWEAVSESADIFPATLVDPSATVGKNCEIGGGSIICAGAVLTVGVAVGRHCILNLGCGLGHDARLDDFCTLHPRVNLSGDTRVGASSDIGTGAIIRDEVRIGENTIIGMGSLVTKDIPAGVVAYGAPCRVIRENTDGIVFR